MERIDFWKVFDIVLHSWIVEMLVMVKMADNVKGLLCGGMSNWKTVLTSNGGVFGYIVCPDQT